VFYILVSKNILNSRDNQQIHIHKYVQSHNIIFQKNVSLTPVTFIGCVIAKCNQYTVNCTKKLAIKPVDTGLDFSVAFLMVIKYKILLSLKYEK